MQNLTELLKIESGLTLRTQSLTLWIMTATATWELVETQDNDGDFPYGFPMLKLHGSMHELEIQAAVQAINSAGISLAESYSAIDADDLQHQYEIEVERRWKAVHEEFQAMLDGIIIPEEDGVTFWQSNQDCAPMLLKVGRLNGFPRIVDAWGILKELNNRIPGYEEIESILRKNQIR